MACKLKFQGKEISENDINKFVKDIDNRIKNNSIPNKTSHKEHQRIANILSANNANNVQKFVAHKLVADHALIDSTNENFYTMHGDKYMRTTQYISMQKGYGFDGDDSKYEINRQWGNTINTILDNAIEGKGLAGIDFEYIDRAVAQQIYDYFKAYNFGKNVVVLTQVKLAMQTKDKNGNLLRDTEGNIYKGIAGTADIVVIDEYGQVQVLDLKSSINPTARNYTVNKNGVSYTNGYGKRFKDKASTKQKHASQMTVYHHMIKSKGFSMNTKNPIGILPIHIKKHDNKQIQEVEPEPLISDHRLNPDLQFMDTYGKDEDMMNLLNKIKLNLGKRKDKAISENRSSSYINSIIQAIESVNDATAIETFVDDMYTSIFGGPVKNGVQNWVGYDAKLKRLMFEYENVDDKVKLLNKINTIREFIEMVKSDNIIRDLNFLTKQHKEMFGNYEKGSVLHKLAKISDKVDEMERILDKEIPDIIATVLANQISQENINTMIQRLKDDEAKLAKLKAMPVTKFRKSTIEALEKKIAERRRELLLDEEGYNIDMKAVIKHEITVGGYKDISTIDKFMNPGTSMPTNFLPAFALLIKNAFTKMRFELINKSREFEKMYSKALGGRSRISATPEEMSKNYVTTTVIEGVEVLTIQNVFDYDKYLKAKEQAVKTLSAEEFEKWMEENTEMRPKEDYKIDGIVFIEGQKTIEKKKARDLSVRDFESWKKGDKPELTMPKLSIYGNKNFDTLKNDEVYMFLVKNFLEAQSFFPKRNYEYERFIAPYVPKNTADKFRENILKGGNIMSELRYEIENATNFTKEDMNQMNYTEYKTIPQFYYNQSNKLDHRQVSKDLFYSIMLYYQSAKKYQIMNEHKILADDLVAYVNNTSPAITDSEGFKVLSKAARYVGLDRTPEDYVPKGTNNIAGFLEMYVDTMIYGKTRVNENMKVKLFGMNLDFGKVSDTIMRFASYTQIGFNFITPLSNYLQGQTANVVEAAAGSIFSTRSLAKSKLIYNMALMDFAKDMMAAKPESLIGLMVEKYDPIQGDFYNNFGQKITRSVASRNFSGSIGFALQHMGEHAIQVRAMIAQMLDTVVMKEDGTQTNMFDALEVKDGELVYKEGIIPPDEVSFINKMNANNQRLHGIYHNQGAPMIERYNLGRILIFYRKFLVPGWKKRWKKAGFDHELGDETMGMYRVFYKKLFTETGELFNALMGKESTLTEFEKQNVSRALREHMIVMLTGIMVLLLSRLRDDEDDEKTKYAYGLILYFTMRLNSELSIYGAISDVRHPFVPDLPNIENPFRNVTALSGIFTRVFKVYQYLISDMLNLISGDDINRYVQDTGVFQKGDSKSYAALLKLLGVGGNKSLSDIDQQIENLMFIRGN